MSGEILQEQQQKENIIFSIDDFLKDFYIYQFSFIIIIIIVMMFFNITNFD